MSHATTNTHTDVIFNPCSDLYKNENMCDQRAECIDVRKGVYRCKCVVDGTDALSDIIPPSTVPMPGIRCRFTTGAGWLLSVLLLKR